MLDGIRAAGRSVLRVKLLRRAVMVARYAALRSTHGLRTLGEHGSSQHTVRHNLKLLLGMDDRVERLLHGVLLLEDVTTFRTLAVGCRNENDLLLMNAYGIDDVIGLDLISYSPRVVLGDMHAIPFPDDHFDLVFCPYTIAYSKTPRRCAAEFVRVVRDGGFVALAVEYIPAEDRARIQQALAGYTIVPDERIDSVQAILDLFGDSVAAVHVHYDALKKRHHRADGLVPDPSPILVVFSIKKPARG